MDEPNLYVGAFVMALGVVSHLLKKVVERRKTDSTFHLKDYLESSPYQTALIVIGAVVGFFVLDELGQLTYASAYGLGWMANSLGDSAAVKASSALSK